MRTTIVPHDSLVLVDGKPKTIDCTSMSPDIHAVQWYDTRGEIEYVNTPGQPQDEYKANEPIDSMDQFQDILDLYESTPDPAPPPPPPFVKEAFDMKKTIEDLMDRVAKLEKK